MLSVFRRVRDDIARRLGREVRVANDANCFALSEAIDGAGRGARIVFGAILGTGVGGGIIVDGRVLEGPNAIAGEWGHNPLPWPGPEEWPGPSCYCGKTGCVETFLSGPGLSRDHRERTGRLDADRPSRRGAETESRVAPGGPAGWLQCGRMACRHLARRARVHEIDRRHRLQQFAAEVVGRAHFGVSGHNPFGEIGQSLFKPKIGRHSWPSSFAVRPHRPAQSVARK